MPTETFIPKTFTAEHQGLIDTANAICREFARQAIQPTLRQVYYQFVAHHGLSNKPTEYKRLGGVLNDARLAGQLDWDYLEDRARGVSGGFWGFRNPGHMMENVAGSYSEAIWEGQPYRPEVWVEKEALVSIIDRACGPTRTPTLACKGYMSASEMYAAAKRIERRRDEGLIPVVIHLGDHDPSGIDMTRDIRERLEMMSWGDVEVRRIALNMDQIEEYGPPPNPAKITDSRAADYIAQFGRESWELDALDPTTLIALVRDTLEEFIDRDAMDAALEHEAANEARIQVLLDRWPDLEDRWSEVEALLDDGQ